MRKSLAVAFVCCVAGSFAIADPLATAPVEPTAPIEQPTAPIDAPATRGTRFARGEILRVEAERITAMPHLPPRDDEPAGPRTYDLDDQTEIVVAVSDAADRTDEAGVVTRSFSARPGTRADLQPGRRAVIHADGDRALTIMLLPDDFPTTRRS